MVVILGDPNPEGWKSADHDELVLKREREERLSQKVYDKIVDELALDGDADAIEAKNKRK